MSKNSSFVKGSSFIGNQVEKEELILEAQQLYEGEELELEILKIKKEYSKTNKSSSLTTIFAVCNACVGTIVLTIPVNFGQSGVIMSLIIMFFMGVISAKTCAWIVRNTRDDEDDISLVVNRILGKRMSLICALASSMLVFCVGMLYFLLLNGTFWQILEYFFAIYNVTNVGKQTEITWDKFSIQWQAIGMIIIVYPMLFVKKIGIIVKLSGYGHVSIYLYIIFIFYIFFDNLNEIPHLIGDMALFPSTADQVAQIIGNFSLAFQVHNSVTQLMSTNANKKKNVRDIIISYVLICFVYGSIGTFGTLGLLGKSPQKGADPAYIYAYFDPSNIAPFIVALFFFAHLISVFPLFIFLSKAQFFPIFYKHTTPPVWQSVLYNTVFAAICLVLQLQNVSINIVIGLTGTCFGFLFVYILPIQLRLKELNGETNNNVNEEQQQEDQEYKPENYLYGVNQTENSMEINDTLIVKSSQKEENKIEKNISYVFRIALMTFFMLVGFSCMCLSLYQVFA